MDALPPLDATAAELGHRRLRLARHAPGLHEHGRPRERAPAAEPAKAESEATLRLRRSEKTSVFIETQEGDIVRLRLTTREALSVAATQLQDGETVVAEATLEAKSSTRLALHVKGDLNEAELAAVRDVFESASALADEFFAGDLPAALATASAFDIDTEQLAHVALRLRAREQVGYRLAGALPATATPAEPVAPSTQAAGHAVASDSAAAPRPASPATATLDDAEPTAAASSAEELAAEDTTEDQAAEDTIVAETIASDAAAAARAYLFGAIVDFMSALIESLDEVAPEDAEQPATVSATAGLAVKLKVFNSVILAIAEREEPGAEPDPARLATLLVDGLAAEQQAPLNAEA